MCVCVKWVLKPENSLVWHREVISWINKYAGLDEGSSLAEAVEGAKIW